MQVEVLHCNTGHLQCCCSCLGRCNKVFQLSVPMQVECTTTTSPAASNLTVLRTLHILCAGGGAAPQQCVHDHQDYSCRLHLQLTHAALLLCNAHFSSVLCICRGRRFCTTLLLRVSCETRRMPYLTVLLHNNKVRRAINDRQLQALKLWCRHCTPRVQVEVLQRDNARLTSENNQLHLQLLRESEKVDAAASEGYQASRRLQSQITELTYWKQQTVERFVELEKENAGLKGRINDLLRLGERTPRREMKHSSAGVHHSWCGNKSPHSHSPAVCTCVLSLSAALYLLQLMWRCGKPAPKSICRGLQVSDWFRF